jgi:hypothetical protein
MVFLLAKPFHEYPAFAKENSADAQIWLTTVYDKDEMADLSTAERRALKAALEAELPRRAARRRPRRK